MQVRAGLGAIEGFDSGISVVDQLAAVARSYVQDDAGNGVKEGNNVFKRPDAPIAAA